MNSGHFSELITLNTPLNAEQSDVYTVPFNILKDSFVFDGHFPEQPILPGVVMVEILKQGIELVTAKKINLVEANNFKFLKMINPQEVDSATLTLTIKNNEKGLAVKGVISTASDQFFKASAQYEILH